MPSLTDAPVTTSTRAVPPDWIDFNGHMNVAWYTRAFDLALDEVYGLLGLGPDYVRDEQASTFTLEQHVCFLSELREGETLEVTFQLLDHDSKRLHCFMTMYHAGEHRITATMEQLSMHVDMRARRATPFPETVRSRIETMAASHGAMPTPAEAGRGIRIRR